MKTIALLLFLGLQTSLHSFAQETCVRSPHWAHAKFAHCQVQFRKFWIDFSATNFLKKDYQNAIVSATNAQFEINFMDRTEIDANSFLLRFVNPVTKSSYRFSSQSPASIGFDVIFANNSGRCGMIAEGSLASCAKGVETIFSLPQYQALKFGECDLKLRDKFPDSAYYNLKNACRPLPALYPDLVADSSIYFSSSFQANYPVLTVPFEVSLSRTFEPRPGHIAIFTVLFFEDNSIRGYIPLNEINLDCGIKVKPGQRLIWMQRLRNHPEEVTLREDLVLNGKTVGKKDQKIFFKEKVKGSGQLFISYGPYYDQAVPTVPWSCPAMEASTDLSSL